MKRLVSQKTLAIRSPFLAPYSLVHQHGEYVWVVHQITDLSRACQRTTGQRHFKLRSRHLTIDALSNAEKPNPGPFHFEGKWQSRHSLKRLSLVARNASPNRLRETPRGVGGRMYGRRRGQILRPQAFHKVVSRFQLP